MNRLRELRERYNLSLRKVESMVGTNIANLSRFERELSISMGETILNLSKAFAVTADYMLGMSDTGFILTYEEDGQEKQVTVPDFIYNDYLSKGYISEENYPNRLVHRVNDKYINKAKIFDPKQIIKFYDNGKEITTDEIVNQVPQQDLEKMQELFEQFKTLYKKSVESNLSKDTDIKK